MKRMKARFAGHCSRRVVVSSQRAVSALINLGGDHALPSRSRQTPPFQQPCPSRALVVTRYEELFDFLFDFDFDP
jgi:hypothetical protein